jgi:hypothetical protein
MFVIWGLVLEIYLVIGAWNLVLILATMIV